MKKTLLSLSLVLASLCSKSYAQTNVFDNIIATSPNHTLLEAALLQEGLASVLQTPVPTSPFLHQMTKPLQV